MGTYCRASWEIKLELVACWAQLFVFDGHICELSQVPVEWEAAPSVSRQPGVLDAPTESYTLNLDSI